MSHFAVLVIGDDYEARLAPYHEFECTDVDDEYVQIVDEGTAQYEADFVKHGDGKTMAEFIRYWTGNSPLGPDDEPDLSGDQKYGWVRLDADGNLVEVKRRTNPNSKWDWYSVGGRWRGFFQAKAGALAEVGRSGVNAPEFNADCLRKGDIDFAGMRAVAEAKAELDYTLYEDAIDGTSEPETWAVVRDRYPENIDAARAEYKKQPRIIALEKADLMPWMDEVEGVYGGGREAFVSRAVAGVAVPYAVVKDGEWFAKGEMGWFGMSDDTETQDGWNQRVQDLYDSLADDTLLTLVDCHV